VGTVERKAQLMGVDWIYDHEHRVQLLRDKAFSWLASDHERQKQQGCKREAVNSYQISPAHAFAAKAYGHLCRFDGSIINDTNPHRTANCQKLSQSLPASQKGDHGIGCPTFRYSQTHRVLRGMESNRWWRGLDTFRQWRC
jgi:hypothetical protein